MPQHPLSHNYMNHCLNVQEHSEPIMLMLDDRIGAGSGRSLVRLDYPSYLNDNCNRVRNSVTLPSSIFTSIFTTSATRRSRSVPAAVCTAVFAASSQDRELVPITSVTL